MICITSFDRPKMLLRLLKELQGCGHRICVFDDASGYPYTEYVQLCEYYRAGQHRGKERYWMQWKWMFDMCKHSDADQFIFLADDWHDIELDCIHGWLDRLDGKFAFNVTNNGIKTNWTPIKRQETDIKGKPVYKVGFVDCGFFTNRETLEALEFRIDEVPLSRFKTPGISSGVGQQLSNRLMNNWIPMYQPVKSMAWHDGTHESKMNPNERIKNPLIPQ